MGKLSLGCVMICWESSDCWERNAWWTAVTSNAEPPDRIFNSEITMFCLLLVICFAMHPSVKAFLVYLSCSIPPSWRIVHSKQKFDGRRELSNVESTSIRWWMIRAWTPVRSDLWTIVWLSIGKLVKVLGWERETDSSSLASHCLGELPHLNDSVLLEWNPSS